MYILYINAKFRWVDKEDIDEEDLNNPIDNEDEKRDDEMNEYEAKYNFRFEE